MSNDLDAQINSLNERICLLEKQKRMLSDFMELLPDCISSIIATLGQLSREETDTKLHQLQMSSFDTMQKVVALDKPAQ